MSSHGRSGGALIRPQHRNLISNKNHNCNAKNESLLRNHSGPSLAEALETALAYLNDLTHWRWVNDDQEGKRANASSTLANVVELVKPKDGSIPAYLMQQRGQLQ
jgi:hypothetical protein